MQADSAASIHVPADPVEAVIQRVWRAYENEVARTRTTIVRATDEYRRDRVATWLAGVSYGEWFALVDRLREVEASG